jgi:hypothetical protein
MQLLVSRVLQGRQMRKIDHLEAKAKAAFVSSV